MLRKEVAARNNLWISGRDSEPFLENEKLRPSTACCMFIFILQVEERKGDYIMLIIRSYQVLKKDCVVEFDKMDKGWVCGVNVETGAHHGESVLFL